MSVCSQKRSSTTMTSVKRSAQDESTANDAHSAKVGSKRTIADISSSLSFSDEAMKVSRFFKRVEKTAVDNIAVQDSPLSKILCIITNDVKKNKDLLEEKGNSGMFMMNTVVLQCFSKPGFLNAPYEPSKDVPPKKRIFTNAEGSPLDKHKPVMLASTGMLPHPNAKGNDTMNRALMLCSYDVHPNEALRTKCRGAPTGKVGAIYPGTPMNFMIFTDACKIEAGNTNDVNSIPPYSIAIVGIRMKSKAQVDKGWGADVKYIQVLSNIDFCMSGIFDGIHHYSPYDSIDAQTKKIMNYKHVSVCMSSDYEFVRNLIRQQGDNMDKVSEKPLVKIPSSEIKEGIKVHVAPSNSSIQILIKNDEKNIYNDMTLDVIISPSAFTQRTSLLWIKDLYDWYIESKCADIYVLHDEYRYGISQEKEGVGGLRCFLVPNTSKLFENKEERLNLKETHVSDFQTKFSEGTNLLEKLENGSDRFSGWKVCSNRNVVYVVIMDQKEIKKPRLVDGSEGDVPHSSLVCQPYKGMSQKREVYIGYLVKMTEDNILAATLCGFRTPSDSDDTVGDPAEMLAVPYKIDVSDIF